MRNCSQIATCYLVRLLSIWFFSFFVCSSSQRNHFAEMQVWGFVSQKCRWTEIFGNHYYKAIMNLKAGMIYGSNICYKPSGIIKNVSGKWFCFFHYLPICQIQLAWMVNHIVQRVYILLNLALNSAYNSVLWNAQGIARFKIFISLLKFPWNYFPCKNMVEVFSAKPSSPSSRIICCSHLSKQKSCSGEGLGSHFVS